MQLSVSEGRLLTQVLDQQALDSPSSLYCIHPSYNEKDDWVEITIHQFSNAVNRLAWWINGNMNGKIGQQVLAYIGTNDLRYGAFVLACMKKGHTALLLSTRNSQQAQRHLLEITKCSILVDGSEKSQLKHAVDEIEAICVDVSLERWQMPGVGEVFQSEKVPLFSHDVQFHDVEDLPAIIIHSSGTTGFPKPVNVTHGYLATIDNMQTLPVPVGRQISLNCLHHRGEVRLFYSPMFHFMGIICLAESLFFQTPFFFVPDRPLTPGLFSQIMNSNNPPTWGALAPYTLEALMNSEDGIAGLKKLSGVIYGGAPMAEATGNKLSSMLRVQTVMGSSETSYTPGLQCEDPADWAYNEWVPGFDLRMEDAGNDLWELVLPQSRTRQYHGISHSYPQVGEYRTGDLFRSHPSKSGLWRYDGRRDDLIVLSNGEKFNPIEAEGLIGSHPLVNKVVIFGQGRFQAALLVEPSWEQLPSSWTFDLLKRTIWPLVEKANMALPAYAKIFESHIAFTSRDKPFQLSPKGTIRRLDIVRDYEAELESLYERKNAVTQPLEHKNDPLGTDFLQIQDWIQQEVAQTLNTETVDPESDLSVLGMDSLQVIQLSQRLEFAERELFELQKPSLWTSAEIYDLSTISQLTQALYGHIHGHEPPDQQSRASIWSRKDKLIRSIWQQAQLLGSSGLTIAITGTTGELGSYVLNSILQDPSISLVICLNRSSDAAKKQVASFEQKELSTPWLTETSRVQFWTCSLDERFLGLESQKYTFLKENVDIVLHNAWPVNFNKPLDFFAPQIAGTRRLLTLVGESSRHADFHFVSSVSSVSTVMSQTTGSEIEIAESLPEVTQTLDQGYGESKFVAEHLCKIASDQSESRIAIHRVGQLGGPTNPKAGMWNTRDWFPCLVRSSRTMKKIPSTLGPLYVDWLPIDTAARIVTEILQSRQRQDRPSFMVYHITNPNLGDWRALVDIVARACDANVVPLAEWVRDLELRVAGEAGDQRDIPAAGLLDFFRFLVSREGFPKLKFSVANSQMESKTLRRVNPVNDHLMNVWLRQWKEWIPGLVV
ncbi:NRPS-like enzyme [Penicillium angulare]|uniref:NRPS-like enzyme n=1 Tax=Penicillium angulare TaxID=116970 RepID=A0A9W9FZV9_9EURO|nr:NRPS-like enzyme [Penicillium angulare]